jgi:nucleoside-triphosphatase THEP1
MIYILSGPIRSGKTSRLLKWAEGRPDLAGIATPDQEGLKMIYDLNTRRYHSFQLGESDLHAEECTSIGKFRFSNAAFLLARQTLARAAQQGSDWLIIDEIGPLELEGRGFEPQSGRIIEQYLARQQRGDLLLVVRDAILCRTIDHYKINQFNFFNF